MIASEVTDLPEPDSPTNPSTSPGAMEKVRSRTAGNDEDSDGTAVPGRPAARGTPGPPLCGKATLR